MHQYYDGSQWQPSAGSLESLGGSLASGPSVISWGKNRLDVFAINKQSQVIHRYWDGSQWSDWETFDNPLQDFRSNAVTLTSWGENRLDIYAVDQTGGLWHLYWDGSEWAKWEMLGASSRSFLGSVGASSWATNRLDIVGLSARTGHYVYKFFDGESWQQSPLGWYGKGPDKDENVLSSSPSVISWGRNRLDIFGETASNEWFHQAWVGDSWYPGPTTWESLGSTE